MDWTILGNKIKNFRKSNKLTQQELADKLEISRSTLSYYELGKIEPNIYTLIKLSQIMNCSLDYLINDVSEDSIKNNYNLDYIKLVNKCDSLITELNFNKKKLLPFIEEVSKINMNMLNNLSKIDVDLLNKFLNDVYGDNILQSMITDINYNNYKKNFIIQNLNESDTLTFCSPEAESTSINDMKESNKEPKHNK